MPKIVAFYNALPTTFGIYKSLALEKFPKIVSVSSIQNEDTSVVETLKELRITFSLDMTDYVALETTDDKNPLTNRPYWDKDKRTLICPVSLNMASKYGFALRPNAVRSVSGYSLSEPFKFSFSTKGYVEAPKIEQYDYRIEADKLIFTFDIPLDIEKNVFNTVNVAGDFNNWDSQAKSFQMNKVADNRFELSMDKSKIGKSGERRFFKFVINGSRWLHPDKNILNIVNDGKGNINLVLSI